MIDVADQDSLRQFYLNAFEAFQQLNCRVIAKSYIKAIEPNKKINFPYNKGDSKKPKWWPSHVWHKEPDHLPKKRKSDLLSS